MEAERVPMVTTYVGRKVSDGNYGSLDIGSWFSLPLGADDAMIQAAQAQADAMIAVQKPQVLSKAKRNDETRDSSI